MKRLYFLVPDLDTTCELVDELKGVGIAESDIHVVARDHDALQAAHLPEAGPLVSSDIVHALGRGVALGGSAGLVAGLTAVSFPPTGLVLGGGAILAMSAFGAGIGAWASSLIGVSVPDDGIRHYEKEVENGAFLMLVDVPAPRVADTSDLIRRLHPDVAIGERHLGHSRWSAAAGKGGTQPRAG